MLKFEIRNSKFAIPNLIAAGLMGAVVFTALALGTVEAWSVALFELIGIVLLLLWAAKALVEKRFDISVPPAALPLGGLVLLGLAQSIAITRSGGGISSLSMDVESTRGAVTVIFFLFVCFLIAANFFTSRERLRLMANFLIVFGLVLAVFALIQHFTWEGRLFWVRPTSSAGAGTGGPFVNRNHFAGYMEMLIPLPIALALCRAVRGEARLFYGFAAVIMGIAQVASLSRAGIVSLAAGLLFLAVVSARRNRDAPQRAGRFSFMFSPAAVNLLIVAAIIVGIFWVGADFDIIKRISSESVATTAASDRKAIWSDTLTMFSANPLLGVGLGAYETVYPVYGRGDGSALIQFAHNDYLQALADGGIVAAALAVWFVIAVFRDFARGVRLRDPWLRRLTLGAGAGVFAILVHSLFDFNLQLPSNALLFLVLSAIVATAVVIEEERARS
jgi:O-antigen ligase